MEPLEFVAAVLPPPGNGRYCVVELSRKKEHAYVHTLEEAQPFIDRWKKTGEDIYFALGTFGDDNNRTADNVHMVKTFAIDVDCSLVHKFGVRGVEDFEAHIARLTS